MFEVLAALSGVKTSDTPVTFVGDVVTYTIQITNSGNTDAVNVTLSDPLPQGTSFIANSLFINEAPQPGTDLTAIGIGTIPPGGAATVTLEVHIDSLPNPPQLVNHAVILFDAALPLPNPPLAQPPVLIPPNIIPVISPNLGTALQANRTVTAPGDTITYTVTASNTGNTNLTAVKIIDVLPSGTAFTAGSVIVNGVPQPDADPTAGIAVGLLPVGQTASVTYLANVTASAGAAISNQAAVSFIPEVLDRTLLPRTKSTNTVTIPILHPSLELTKQADRAEVAFGDRMSYSIRAVNTGNTNLANVIVSDSPPNGTEFIAGSTAINNIPQPEANPMTGINTGGLTPGQSALVTFTVRVIVDEANVVNQAQGLATPDIPGLALPPIQTRSNVIMTPVFGEDE